ncbi:hypothetical protein F5Y15DRAFT_10161 [Xylariaceae sp. FL0016]|nr:hypothetical protein F5Y15DRAFT_10161 [Xylariaceae sp. FL0016]
MEEIARNVHGTLPSTGSATSCDHEISNHDPVVVSNEALAEDLSSAEPSAGVDLPAKTPQSGEAISIGDLNDEMPSMTVSKDNDLPTSRTEMSEESHQFMVENLATDVDSITSHKSANILEEVPPSHNTPSEQFTKEDSGEYSEEARETISTPDEMRDLGEPERPIGSESQAPVQGLGSEIIKAKNSALEFSKLEAEPAGAPTDSMHDSSQEIIANTISDHQATIPVLSSTAETPTLSASLSQDASEEEKGGQSVAGNQNHNQEVTRDLGFEKASLGATGMPTEMTQRETASTVQDLMAIGLEEPSNNFVAENDTKAAECNPAAVNSSKEPTSSHEGFDPVPLSEIQTNESEPAIIEALDPTSKEMAPSINTSDHLKELPSQTHFITEDAQTEVSGLPHADRGDVTSNIDQERLPSPDDRPHQRAAEEAIQHDGVESGAFEQENTKIEPIALLEESSETTSSPMMGSQVLEKVDLNLSPPLLAGPVNEQTAEDVAQREDQESQADDITATELEDGPEESIDDIQKDGVKIPNLESQAGSKMKNADDEIAPSTEAQNITTVNNKDVSEAHYDSNTAAIRNDSEANVAAETPPQNELPGDGPRDAKTALTEGIRSKAATAIEPGSGLEAATNLQLPSSHILKETPHAPTNTVTDDYLNDDDFVVIEKLEEESVNGVVAAGGTRTMGSLIGLPGEDRLVTPDIPLANEGSNDNATKLNEVVLPAESQIADSDSTFVRADVQEQDPKTRGDLPPEKREPSGESATLDVSHSQVATPDHQGSSTVSNKTNENSNLVEDGTDILALDGALLAQGYHTVHEEPAGRMECQEIPPTLGDIVEAHGTTSMRENTNGAAISEPVGSLRQPEVQAVTIDNPGTSSLVEMPTMPSEVPNISAGHGQHMIDQGPVRESMQSLQSAAIPMSGSSADMESRLSSPVPSADANRQPIPEKSSRRALRPPLVHSGEQTDEDLGFDPPSYPSISYNLSDPEPRANTPAVILPDLDDSNARALGRVRSLRRQRRHTYRRAEETVAAAVVMYAAAREISPQPSSRFSGNQVNYSIAQVTEAAQEVNQNPLVAFSPGVEGDRSVEQNDVFLSVADLSTDDEGKSSDRHHRHRRHHRHHHSSQSRDGKGEEERHHRHHHHRRSSDASHRSGSSRSAAETPKRQDSGFSVESSHSSSSRRQRTPEEQAAHEKRKEERRAARDARDKEKESKGKEPEKPETPTSDKNSSHRSSRRHSHSHSERRMSFKDESPVSKKGFFDMKNAESILAPNYARSKTEEIRPSSKGSSKDPPKPDVPKRSSTTTKDSPRPDVSKRSSMTTKHSPRPDVPKRSSTTNKDHRRSTDVSRSKSHKTGDESASKRHHKKDSKFDDEDDVKASSSPSKATSDLKDEHRHSRRAEREKAREAEAKKKQQPSGIRATIKKLFS